MNHNKFEKRFAHNDSQTYCTRNKGYIVFDHLNPYFKLQLFKHENTARNNSHSHFLDHRGGSQPRVATCILPPLTKGQRSPQWYQITKPLPLLFWQKHVRRSTWWRVCYVGFRGHTCIPSKATNFLFKSCKGMNHLRNARVLRVSLQDTEPGGFIVNEEHHMLCSKPIPPHADGGQNRKGFKLSDELLLILSDDAGDKGWIQALPCPADNFARRRQEDGSKATSQSFTFKSCIGKNIDHLTRIDIHNAGSRLLNLLLHKSQSKGSSVSQNSIPGWSQGVTPQLIH